MPKLTCLFLAFFLITNPYMQIDAFAGEQIFENPSGSPVVKNTPEDLILFVAKRILGIGNSSSSRIMHAYTLDKDVALAELLRQQATDTITWIGHATFFIKIGQTHILTDPFFSNTAGKFGFGAKRYSPPPINIEDLPQLDIILCSHNHYDHLDIKSLKRIKKKFGAKVQVFCPIGLAKYFQQCGFTEVQEMRWHEEASHKAITLRCLPAIHNSGRSLFDKNKTLWCSFGMKSKAFDIYFSGDTAYHPKIFKEIKSSLGNCDLAIVGIGAYAPQKILAQYHANPEQGVQIALDVNAKNIVGMHWGTLNLSDEPVDEPIKRFKQTAETHNLKSNAVWLMKLGETRPLQRDALAPQ
jgi:L-ascorbate metabolism protein UlaG (beta-lactamase superfamily)